MLFGTHPTPRGQTHTCENTSFPQLRLREVIIQKKRIEMLRLTQMTSGYLIEILPRFNAKRTNVLGSLHSCQTTIMNFRDFLYIKIFVLIGIKYDFRSICLLQGIQYQYNKKGMKIGIIIFLLIYLGEKMPVSCPCLYSIFGRMQESNDWNQITKTVAL